jgi:cytochrome c oxidase assembly protein subunit 11
MYANEYENEYENERAHEYTGESQMSVRGSDDGMDDRRRSNRSLLKRLVTVVVVMFGFGFAMIPFYNKICEVTGLRNIDIADDAVNTQIDAGRTVRIELDGNLNKLAWRFRPMTSVVSVHPGELTQVMYEVENTTDRPMTGQAVPSYGPQLAGQYFKKLECFCFAKQSFGPHEKRQLPVVFVVDPRLPADVPTITLSYTFFEVEGNES